MNQENEENEEKKDYSNPLDLITSLFSDSSEKEAANGFPIDDTDDGGLIDGIIDSISDILSD